MASRLDASKHEKVPMDTTTASSNRRDLEHDLPLEHVEDVPLDLVNPHKAALEENPDKAELPSFSTCLAIVVSLCSLSECSLSF